MIKMSSFDNFSRSQYKMNAYNSGWDFSGVGWVKFTKHIQNIQYSVIALI